MTKPELAIYQIRVQGRIDHDWSTWFDGWHVEYPVEDETILTGAVKDQSALFGLLLKVRDLNLTLVAVNRLPVIDCQAAEGRSKR